MKSKSKIVIKIMIVLKMRNFLRREIGFLQGTI